QVEIFDIHKFKLGVATPLRDFVSPFGDGLALAAGPRAPDNDGNSKHRCSSVTERISLISALTYLPYQGANATMADGNFRVREPFQISRSCNADCRNNRFLEFIRGQMRRLAVRVCWG